MKARGNPSVTRGECLRPHDLASWDAEISGSCRQADRAPPPSLRRYGTSHSDHPGFAGRYAVARGSRLQAGGRRDTSEL